MNTRLLIVRHGNTFGPGDVVRRVGSTDLPLVASGLQQGRQLGSYLQQNQLIPDVIFTSKLKRTIQTAEQAQLMMGTQLPLEELSIFNEIDYGPDENQPEADVIARLGVTAMQAWEKQAIVPNGWRVDPPCIIKHWEDFSSLILKHYYEKTILVITSNGIARFAPYLTGNFETFAQEHGIKISTGAVCLFEKTLNSKHWNCLKWNIRVQEQ